MKGGIAVTQENESYLRFSLEESVWFQKGQEVEELYSISLDPNVTVTEDDHYVYIRGTLDLSGEYQNDEENDEDEDYRNIFLPKSVQSVERNENGIYEFVHRFPVDITIPSSRIAALDDIEVSIQTFDYSIPERNSLKLQADLIISGIYSETNEEPSEFEEDFEWNEGITTNDVNRGQDDLVEVEISDVLSQLDELVGKTENFADELEKEKETLEIVNQRNDVEEDILEDIEADEELKSSEEYEETVVQNKAAAPPIPDFQPVFRKSEENEGELYEPFIVEAKRTAELEKQEDKEPAFFSKKQDIPSLDIPVQKNQTEEQVQPIEREATPVFEKVEEKEQEVAPFMAESDNKEKVIKEREEVNLLHLVQQSRRPAAPVEKRGQKQEAKQEEPSESKTSGPLSIADYFSRKQEEEHVRVKVCIVQKGETLDDLATRYSISVQSLLQSNELQPNQDIYEGQVLYIRQSQTFKN